MSCWFARSRLAIALARVIALSAHLRVLLEAGDLGSGRTTIARSQKRRASGAHTAARCPCPPALGGCVADGRDEPARPTGNCETCAACAASRLRCCARPSTGDCEETFACLRRERVTARFAERGCDDGRDGARRGRRPRARSESAGLRCGITADEPHRSLLGRRGSRYDDRQYRAWAGHRAGPRVLDAGHHDRHLHGRVPVANWVFPCASARVWLRRSLRGGRSIGSPPGQARDLLELTAAVAAPRIDTMRRDGARSGERVGCDSRAGRIERGDRGGASGRHAARRRRRSRCSSKARAGRARSSLRARCIT